MSVVPVKSEDIIDKDPEEIFEILEVIGQGSFGVVCTCEEIKTHQLYAIKFIEISEDDTSLQKEIDILKEVEHKHIVNYFGCYVKEGALMIVMEYCAGGSLMDIMKVRKLTLNERQIGAVCYHTLRALKYLHRVKILHRDIKAANILVTEDGVGKLADFGVSARLTTTAQRQQSIVGSPYWMAPEVIAAPKGDAGYSYSADIWSLGISAIEMAEGHPPYYDMLPLRVIFVIPSKPPPTLKKPEEFSQRFTEFLTACLVKDAEARQNATQLLKHSFIKRHKKDASSVIQQLVIESLPALIDHRKQAMNEDPSRGSSYLPGSVVKVNTNTREASMISTGTSTGSVVVHTGGTNSGSVVYTRGAVEGGSVVISHLSDLAEKYGSVVISSS